MKRLKWNFVRIGINWRYTSSQFGERIDVSTLIAIVTFFASALFAPITVLLSYSRPGKIASKVSPIEASKYTELLMNKQKRLTTRGAKVHQMAFANLGRNK